MLKRTQKQQPSSGAAEAVVSTQPKFTKEKLRKFLLGSKEREGFLKVFVIYALLTCKYCFHGRSDSNHSYNGCHQNV